MQRNTIYRLLFKTLTPLLSLSVVMSISADPHTIETPQGKIQGQTQNEEKSVVAYKGIPYALPPVGARRWRAAEPATGWSGVRDGSNYAPSCVQEPYPEESIFSSVNLPTSEDCLYLNVWSAKDTEKKSPVMVWIHGGALTRGSGSTPAYDGTHLAEKGVVVVTINYRLDIFGHFAHPQLSAENANGVSGNQATTDQVQALQWVKNNIAAYGGDPDNVTIFGESAGSWSVHHLVATPLAKNLFHKAIGQSGSVMDVMQSLKFPVGSIPPAEQSGMAVAKNAGVDSVSELRLLTAGEILALSKKSRFRSRGVVDGYVFPDQIYNLMSEGKQNKVDVMLGFNADEGTVLGALANVPKNKEAYKASLNAQFSSMADEFAEMYSDENIEQSMLAIFRDRFVTWSMQSWAMMTANVKKDAYLYYFTHRPPGPMQDRLGAYHAAEIRYAFDNYPENLPKEQALADMMSKYWVSFAKNGDPNVKGQPEWKPYTAKRRNYIEFNNETKSGAVLGKDVLPGVWELWETFNARNRP